MKSAWQTLHKIGNILHLPDIPRWLIILLIAVFLLRIPSFFEPYSYGDEMIYLTLGQGIRQGLTLYKDIYDNKPPLLYITAAIAGSLFWFKAILAFWNLATIIIFWKLTEVLFKDRKTASKVATIIFGLITTIPLLEGNIINAELFMIGPSLLAFLLILSDNLTNKKIFFAGFLLGVAALFKIPASFEAPVIVFYWFFSLGLKNWREILKNTVILSAGFAAPILLTFVYFFFKGALGDYIKAAFLQNVGYLSSFRPGDVQKSFLVRNGPLLTRFAVVLLGSGLLGIFRKKLSLNFILFCLWILFSLFAVTLSERPYPHYLIQSAAPISLLLAVLFTERSLEQSLVVIPLALTFFVPVYYKYWLYPVSSYYLRFGNFALGKISKTAYFNSFSGTLNRDYAIADFLTKSSIPTDRVFMWDPDSPIIYALARRLPPEKFIVPYHVHDYSSPEAVVSQMTQNPPKFIVLTTGNPLPEISALIKSRYILIQQIGNAEIWSIVYNPPNGSQP